MSHTIWKFVVPLGQPVQREFPVGMQVVHAGPDPATGHPAFWAKLDPAARTVSRRCRAFATGDLIADRWEYLGTAVCGPFVWHIHTEV